MKGMGGRAVITPQTSCMRAGGKRGEVENLGRRSQGGVGGAGKSWKPFAQEYATNMLKNIALRHMLYSSTSCLVTQTLDLCVPSNLIVIR